MPPKFKVPYREPYVLGKRKTAKSNTPLPPDKRTLLSSSSPVPMEGVDEGPEEPTQGQDPDSVQQPSQEATAAAITYPRLPSQEPSQEATAAAITYPRLPSQEPNQEPSQEPNQEPSQEPIPQAAQHAPRNQPIQQPDWKLPQTAQDRTRKTQQAPKSGNRQYTNKKLTLGPLTIQVGSSNPQVDNYPDIPRRIVAHVERRRYIVGYGDLDGACGDDGDTIISLRIEDAPSASLITDYESNPVSATQATGRILENIFRWHRGEGRRPPRQILSSVRILAAVWDSKKGLGRDNDLSVLEPTSTKKERVRCLVSLDPSLYAEDSKLWGISNLSGISWETRTIVLQCLEGRNQREKKQTFFNRITEREKKWQATFLSSGQIGLEKAEGGIKQNAELLGNSRNPSTQSQSNTQSKGAGSIHSLLSEFKDIYSQCYGPYKDLDKEAKIDFFAAYERWKKEKVKE